MKAIPRKQFPRIVARAPRNPRVIGIQEFQAPHPINYPIDNDEYFEQWYMNNFKADDKRGREYLPILWTAVQCRANFRNKSPLLRLQSFINSLDKSKKYYSIIQHDDGCQVNLSDFDIKIFSMTGKPCDYPIPLLCKPHKDEYKLKKDIFASFIGNITHPLRRILINELNRKTGYHVSVEKHSMKDFCRILSRSLFTLCPRGYGISSFRICEAIQYGAIPVYISDEFIIPYNIDFNEYGVLINASDISRIDEILKSISPLDIKKKQDKIKEIGRLFTYEGCKKIILNEVEKDNSLP